MTTVLDGTFAWCGWCNIVAVIGRTRLGGHKATRVKCKGMAVVLVRNGVLLMGRVRGST